MERCTDVKNTESNNSNIIHPRETASYILTSRDKMFLYDYNNDNKKQGISTIKVGNASITPMLQCPYATVTTHHQIFRTLVCLIGT